MTSQVTSVIIIPSYNEKLALPELLNELKEGLTELDAVLIMDDSDRETSNAIELECRKTLEGASLIFDFDNSGSKSGRGAAIRRGLSKALIEFPKATHFLECDADGSHRPVDILRIKESESEADLLVGSRYLATSQIVGWPISRRIFSWILNKIIPRATSVELRDITNGLRRYSRDSVCEILSVPQINTGFIYLSEQAILLTRRGRKIEEEPIVFVDRTLGQSTVTWREISHSLIGVLKLLISKK
jgi:dolichol-phosphate mannosyltransferase